MLEEHLGYVADSNRLAQFRIAIARVARPGGIIADLGCGTGILGLLCLQAGAGRVFAIDSTAMINVARQTLARAGYGNRCVFVHGHSHRVELPERVDLVICDHVGYFGFDYDIMRTLQDARRRFLKPEGTLIPARIRLLLAAIESESGHAKAENWRAAGVSPEFHWLHGIAVNAEQSVELSRETLLSSPAVLDDIDLRTDSPEFFRWTAELRVERDGAMHGLAGWFECELSEGVWMTNSPLAEQPIRRAQAFLPIDEAVRVSAGDSVRATVMARPADNLIAWIVDFPRTGRRFSHSTWHGSLLAPEELTRSRPDRVPNLSREGAARVTVLGYCDGRRTAHEIEQAVLKNHPNLFPSPEEISRFVAQVVGWDTE
jgi:SAM-dependent methyltransferase